MPELDYRGELGRKALHLLALLIPAGMLVLDRSTALQVLIPLAVVALGADVCRSRISRLESLIDRWFGWMMRSSERGPSRKRLFNGATWVVVTGALLLLVFPAHIAAPAMATAMIGDAAAALVGRKVGRHRWPGGLRTVEGSAAFLVTGLAVAALFNWLSWPARALSVAAAMAAEALPLPINDNLLLPFVAAAILSLMS